jgi:cytochrome c nitrite reductase small subunit
MKTIINDNCIRCHSATVSNVNMTAKAYCTDCHRTVPHMNRRPLSERRAADV